MSDLQLLILSLLVSAATLGAFLLRAASVLAAKVEKAIDIKHDITVQAPTALIPEHITGLLMRIEEKLEPPPRSPMNDSLLSDLIEQGWALAEGRKDLKGPDKFRVAREYVMKRAEEMQLAVDARALALRIEATVVAHKPVKK